VAKDLPSTLPPQEVADFTKHIGGPSVLEEEAYEQRKELSQKVGLVCLTEKFRCPGYSGAGAAHLGCAYCCTPFGGARKVEYPPRLPRKKWDGSNIGEVCWSKHEAWKYEQEWRVVEPLSRANPHPTRAGYFVLRFKAVDLLRVILGLEVDPEIEFQLGQMLHHREFEHVSKEVAYIDPDTRELESRPLPW
jgi:hypothetical protein